MNATPGQQIVAQRAGARQSKGVLPGPSGIPRLSCGRDEAVTPRGMRWGGGRFLAVDLRSPERITP